MKNFFTKRNIVLLVGAVLAIAAFFLAFGGALVYSQEAGSVTMSNIIIGTQKVITVSKAGGSIEVPVPAEEVVHAGLSLVGIIMMLVGGIAAVVMGIAFKGKKWTKIALIVAAVVIIVGAVFVFMMKGSYTSSVVAKQKVDPADVKEYLKDFKVSALAIVSGVVGVLSAAAVGVSAFMKD